MAPWDDGSLPLSRDQIRRWSQAFGELGARRWQTALAAADRFWTSASDPERLVTWSHLLLAVGNFKRQAPITPPAFDDPRLADAGRPTRLEVPASNIIVLRDDDRTWEALGRSTPGLGIPTTTTLLSALWPGHHVIIDRLARAAAIGIAASGGQAVRIQRNGFLPRMDWHDYVIYRGQVLATAHALDVEPTQVERSLYQLAQGVPDEADRTWAKFGAVLLERARGQPDARRDDGIAKD